MAKLPWVSRTPTITLRGNEKVIESFSTHWVKYVVPVLLYTLIVAVTVVTFLFARSNLEDAPLLAHGAFLSGICTLAWIHHWFFHRILSEGMVDVIITNKRLIFLEDRLWFYDNIHEVTLSRIRAIEANQTGIFGNLFNYGTLWFDTGGSDQEASIIPLIPHPHRVAKKINTLLEFK